jgi:uncharacterized damage-inducible protein DinB
VELQSTSLKRERTMQPFFEDYLNLLQRLHDDARKSFQDLPQEALDWTPAPEMNSFVVLVTHLVGAERYWIGDVAGEEPSGRIREEEFQARGLKSGALSKLLSNSFNYAQDCLGEFNLQQLGQPRTVPRDEQKVSVGWALAHALEHTALHVGHMQILRQWWDHEQAK